MGVAIGIVVAGKVVVEGLDLTEGSTVTMIDVGPLKRLYRHAE